MLQEADHRTAAQSDYQHALLLSFEEKTGKHGLCVGGCQLVGLLDVDHRLARFASVIPDEQHHTKIPFAANPDVRVFRLHLMFEDTESILLRSLLSEDSAVETTNDSCNQQGKMVETPEVRLRVGHVVILK